MKILIGLLIIAVGSFGQSSSYVPIKKVKEWSWETFWMVQGFFAWYLIPFAGAHLAVPEGYHLGILIDVDTDAALKAFGYGLLWGVGGLTFGLSMRYLGIALGQSIALGTCSAFGTLIPALISGTDLLHGTGLILLIGVCITLAGIAVIGYAGSLRAQHMTEEEKKAAIKDFALTKGLFVALLAGVMSACFALGLEAGKPLVVEGTNELFASLPATMLVTWGGFLTNAVYCAFQHTKNKSWKEYTILPEGILISNYLFCVLAGLLWYSQFFGLSMGKSYFADSPVMLAFSWSILMSLNVLFSNFWGIVLKEWKGAGRKTVYVLIAGMAILIFSLIFPNLI